jgi:hypothetical protein
MDVFTPLGQHPDSVMSTQNGSVGPNFQRTALAGSKRRFQFCRREAAKLLKLYRVQSALGMQRFEVR